jgi:hypothetical protein
MSRGSLKGLLVCALLGNGVFLGWQLSHRRGPARATAPEPPEAPAARAPSPPPSRRTVPAATSRPGSKDCPAQLEQARGDEQRALDEAVTDGAPQDILDLTPPDDHTRDRVREILAEDLRGALGPAADDVQVECSRFACRVSVLQARGVSPQSWQLSVQRNPQLRALGARFALAGTARVVPAPDGRTQLIHDVYLASKRLGDQ